MNNMETTKPPYRKLWRSRRDKKIAGVCGGLAVYFGVDPFWVRFAFVLFFLLGGAAFLLYLIMWFLIPLEPRDWH
ncbi:PspC domain-containing protein [Legionella genomosp. 1]|uniref:PspC domain-containing protein n=1 Tax=Legionella genomosp. 1 TaxID=1093625 RepID=UPI0029161B73|nr:PspC domain-containing protein [Legionella genomosp. 1]